MEEQASLLYSQLGYYPLGDKQAFLRGAPACGGKLAGSDAFTVVDAHGAPAYAGTLRYWGEIWRSHWWVADFTDFTQVGEYRVVTDAGASLPFLISEDVLSRQGLRTVALDQLDDRKVFGSLGWRDCGTEIRELSSMVVTVLALLDLWENPAMLTQDRARLMETLCFGVDSLLASQEHWRDDPERDGRFNHDAFRRHFSSDYHNWHDTAYTLTALARAYPLLRLYAPERAQACLAACEKGYDNATRRPYHLESDFKARTHPQIPYAEDEFGEFFHSLAANMYDKPQGWQMPHTLRTRDKLMFADACCLLYEATGEGRYLDTAVAFANSACARQCRHAEGIARDGVGFFYEFEDDDDAFVLEFAHNHRSHMGSITPVTLSPLVKLARLLPNSPHVAEWMNTLRAYADLYVKTATALTPLSIYPVSVYKNPVHGGVKFFGIVVHGFTCLYGMIAKNLFVLSDFLQDDALARLGERNLMFAVGRNPGFPDRFDATRWTCKSLIKGVGSNTFGGHHDLAAVPDGSAMNGFAMTQFSSELRLGDLPDEPQGIRKPDDSFHFNEDYLPHSHAYASGVAWRERDALLSVRALMDGRPVRAEAALTFHDGEEVACPLGADGRGTLSLRPMRGGMLRLTYGDCTWQEPVYAAPGGHVTVCVDFARCLRVTAQAEPLHAGQEAALTLTVQNCASRDVDAELRLQASGVALAEDALALRVQRGERVTRRIAMRAAAQPTTYAVCLLPLAAPDGVQVLASGRVEA